jgi:hypothetical protein
LSPPTYCLFVIDMDILLGLFDSIDIWVPLYFYISPHLLHWPIVTLYHLPARLFRCMIYLFDAAGISASHL